MFYNSVMQPAASESGRRDLLADVGKLTGLVAVLLPAAGVAVRYVFLARYSVAPSDLAVRAPLAELAVTGFWALLPALALAIPVALLAGLAPWFVLYERNVSLLATINSLRDVAQIDLEGLSEEAQVAEVRALLRQIKQIEAQVREVEAEHERLEAEHERLERSWFGRLPSPPLPPWVTNRRWAERTVLSLPWVVLAVFIPDWPVFWVYLGSSLLMYLAAMRLLRRTARLEIARLWWVIVLVLLAFSIASGLQGNLPGVFPQTVSFRSAQGALGLKDGTYERVGDDPNTYYFLTCQPRKRQLVAVQRDEVLVVTSQGSGASSNFGPSLFSVIFLGATVQVPVEHIC